MLAVVGVGEHLLEMARHRGAMVVEFGQQRVETAEPHRLRHAPAIVLGQRQAVRLRIVEILQAVFEPAQEVVGRCQFGGGIGMQDAALGQQLQHLLGRLDLQRRVAAAADQLEHLGDELDFTDAAGTQFDVVGHVLLRHFSADLGVQPAHRVDRAEIEILAKDEGLADLLQLVVAAAGQRPRLDPGVALPFAALRDEIVFQHVEGANQRPGIAIRPQPHVDPKHLAVLGHFGDGADQAAAKTGKKLEVGNGTRVCVDGVRIAILGKNKNQVDVGRHV